MIDRRVGGNQRTKAAQGSSAHYSGCFGFVSIQRCDNVVFTSVAGSYLHLLVHFHIDGFDFIQLVPQSNQCVLLK